MLLNSWRSIVTAKSVESTFVNGYYYTESAPSRELASFNVYTTYRRVKTCEKRLTTNLLSEISAQIG